jgi:hypothetical protein
MFRALEMMTWLIALLVHALVCLLVSASYAVSGCHWYVLGAAATHIRFFSLSLGASEIAHTLLQLVPQHGHVASITRDSPQLVVVEHFGAVVLKSGQGITLIPPDSHPRRWGQGEKGVNEEVVQAHAAFNYSGSFSQRHFQGFLKNAPSVCQHTECAFDDHSQTEVVEGED